NNLWLLRAAAVGAFIGQQPGAAPEAIAPLVLRTPRARFVFVSNSAHHGGRIDFDDLNWNGRIGQPHEIATGALFLCRESKHVARRKCGRTPLTVADVGSISRENSSS